MYAPERLENERDAVYGDPGAIVSSLPELNDVAIVQNEPVSDYKGDMESKVRQLFYHQQHGTNQNRNAQSRSPQNSGGSETSPTTMTRSFYTHGPPDATMLSNMAARRQRV